MSQAASFRSRSRGFGNIGTESRVKPSSATIAALYELFLVNNRIAQWPQFASRYGFGHLFIERCSRHNSHYVACFNPIVTRFDSCIFFRCPSPATNRENHQGRGEGGGEPGLCAALDLQERAQTWPRNWAVVVAALATVWWPSCCTSWAIACRQTPRHWKALRIRIAMLSLSISTARSDAS